MKNVSKAALLATALSCSMAVAQPLQTVGQDMKDAGHATAHASKTVAHKTAHGTKVAAKDTAHGTRVAADKTADGAKTAGHATAHGTRKVVHKVEGKPDTAANNPK